MRARFLRPTSLPKARRWLTVPGLVLHGMFYALLNVSTFSITMWILYLAYFEPDAVHALLERLQGPPHSGSVSPMGVESKRGAELPSPAPALANSEVGERMPAASSPHVGLTER